MQCGEALENHRILDNSQYSVKRAKKPKQSQPEFQNARAELRHQPEAPAIVSRVGATACPRIAARGRAQVMQSEVASPSGRNSALPSLEDRLINHSLSEASRSVNSAVLVNDAAGVIKT